MRIKGTSSGTRHYRGPTMAEADFTFTQTTVDEVITPGSATAPTTVKDSTFVNATTASVAHQAAITLGVLGTQGAVTLTNLDPSIGTLGSDNILRRVTTGTCRLRAKTRLRTKQLDVPLSFSASTTSTVFNGFVAGSLGRSLTDNFATRLSGKTSSDIQLFSGNTRVASCWASGMDTSCLPVSSNRCVPITTNVVYCVDHYPPGIGGTISFLQMDGTLVTRTITAGYTVSSISSGRDIWLGLLDSPLPAGITPAKLMPAGWSTTYAPGFTNGIPAVGMNQFWQAHVLDLKQINANWLYFRKSADETRASFYGDVIPYDSGSPVFTQVGTTTVLLTSWTFSSGTNGGGAGADLSQFISNINAGITALGGTGTVSTVSLSGFTSY